MPITQERMQNLIAAALDYQRALNTILTALNSAAVRCRDHPENKPREFDDMTMLANPLGLLHAPMQSPAILMTEHQHFKSHASRNNYERRRQLERRQSVIKKAVREKYPTKLIQPMISSLDIMKSDLLSVPVDMSQPAPTTDQLDQYEDKLNSIFKQVTGKPFLAGSGLDEQTKAELALEAEREIARQTRERELIIKMANERIVGPPSIDDNPRPEPDDPQY